MFPASQQTSITTNDLFASCHSAATVYFILSKNKADFQEIIYNLTCINTCNYKICIYVVHHTVLDMSLCMIYKIVSF